MKPYRAKLSCASVAALGALVVACSSKSTDNGVGAGASSAGQGGSSGNSGAGGQSTTLATGGATNYATGGSNTYQPPQACQGLPIDTSAADAGSSVDSDAGTQCAGVGIELEPTPLDMFIMMDRTESMTNLVQNTSLTRWDVLEQGVQQFVTDPTVQAKAPRVGLAFFGKTGSSSDPTECDPNTYAQPQIEIDTLVTNGPKILDAVTAESAKLGGQTPTMAALQGALMHAQAWQVANPSRMTVVVFVTDGYPTECDLNTNDIEQMVGEYYTGVQGTYNTMGPPGIRSYIIGVAVDKFNVDGFAQAGGTGAATIVDNAGAVSLFVSAMVNITGSNISCDIALPEPPSGMMLDPTKVQVVYKPYQGQDQEFPMASASTGCSGTYGGWYFDNPSAPTKISLCPCSCANLGAGSIEFRFGCRPRSIIG